MMTIQKRNIDFGIGAAPAPRWCDNEVCTALFDAFSLFLPPGERFFIRAVNSCADKISDPTLKHDIKGFSAQEALHMRAHEAYNRALQQEGLALEDIYGRVDRLLGTVKGNIKRLAIAVGLEHLTACFGDLTLRHPEILENADPRYRELWTWHALEELEHKAVAFDVFRQVTSHLPGWKRYLLRCGALLVASRHIAKMHVGFATQILMLRGHGDTRQARRRIIRGMLLRPGHYRRVFWYYLKFFSPFFDPSKDAHSDAIAFWTGYFNQRAAVDQKDHAE